MITANCPRRVFTLRCCRRNSATGFLPARAFPPIFPTSIIPFVIIFWGNVQRASLGCWRARLLLLLSEPLSLTSRQREREPAFGKNHPPSDIEVGWWTPSRVSQTRNRTMVPFSHRTCIYNWFPRFADRFDRYTCIRGVATHTLHSPVLFHRWKYTKGCCCFTNNDLLNDALSLEE